MVDTFEAVTVKLPDPDESKFQSAIAKEALRTFHANVERCVGLMRFPPYAYMIGMSWSLSLQHIGTMRFPDTHPETPGYWDEVSRLALEHVDKILTSEYHSRWFSPEHIAKTLLGYGRSLMEMCGPYQYDSAKSVQHLLGAIVVSAWGCVEVLSEQLSEGAVVSGRYLAFSKQDFKNGAKQGYRSRLAIRSNFQVRFQDVAISAILGDEAFSAASLLRNVIAHHAAVADLEFISSLSECPVWLGRYSNISPGEAIRLNGQLVRELLEKLVTLCYDLIVLVDRKL